MKLKTWQKNVLLAAAVAAGGFLMWNVAFMFAAGVINGFNWLVRLFAGNKDFAMNIMFGGYLFVLIVLVISWVIFKSKLPTLAKAIYLTMPLMVLLIFQGIQLFEQPQWIPITIGVIMVGLVLLYLYKKKLSWLYYFATLYTGAMALYVILAGIEI